MYGRCTECDKMFLDQYSFVSHDCVVNAMALGREALLARLLKSGDCSQVYYDQEIAKLEEIPSEEVK